MINGGHQEVNQEPRIIELPIVIDHPAAQIASLDGRQLIHHFPRRHDHRPPEALPDRERQKVVGLEPDAIHEHVAAAITGEDEGAIVDEVRRVSPQAAALAERLQDEPHMSLPEIAHAAVNELGAAAGSAAAEVAALEEQDGVSPRRGINRHPHAGRPAADHDQVPRLAAINHASEHLGAVHPGSVFLKEDCIAKSQTSQGSRLEYGTERDYSIAVFGHPAYNPRSIGVMALSRLASLGSLVAPGLLRTRTLPSVTGIASCPSWLVRPNPTHSSDLDLLQGSWTSVAGPCEARLLVCGNRYTFEFLGGDIYMGMLELGPDGMDMRIEAGPKDHQGKIAQCLFRLEGGVLRWCPGRPGSGRRPTTFPLVDDPRYLSFVFRQLRRTRRRQ